MRQLVEKRETAKGKIADSQRRARRAQDARITRKVHLRIGDVAYRAVNGALGKLRTRLCGPFKIGETKRGNSWLETVDQERLKQALYVNQLKETNDVVFEGAVYEVARIIDHRKSEDKIEYLALWIGYPIDEATREQKRASLKTDR